MSLESISAFATGVGTLVLAVATFFSTRSANRAARTAELAVLESKRPLLMSSKLGDERQKIMFQDSHWSYADGGGAALECVDDVVYLVISLRNVGPGVAVMQGWSPHAQRRTSLDDHPPVDRFRPHTRDLYVPASDIGMWQGALRDRNEPDHAALMAAALERRSVSIDLLYSDVEGHQRTITRFALMPVGEDRWVASVVRHWMLERANPR